MSYFSVCFGCFFFFNDTATTEIYTLSLHDALPIFRLRAPGRGAGAGAALAGHPGEDRKSTRLNSSHLGISYAVFCLKKKKKKPLTSQVTNQKTQNTHTTTTIKTR